MGRAQSDPASLSEILRLRVTYRTASEIARGGSPKHLGGGEPMSEHCAVHGALEYHVDLLAEECSAEPLGVVGVDSWSEAE